jgi:hypothetical protein
MFIGTLKNYDSYDKRYLTKRISDVNDKECYKELFRLVVDENIKYTRNINGIFFNITSLNDEMLNKIDHVLSYHERKNSKNKYINIYNNHVN